MLVYNINMVDNSAETVRVYTKINEKIGNSNVPFLNSGYHPAFEELNNTAWKHQISLYKKCLEGLDLNNNSILEVGCGRGGGSKWISDNYNVKMYGCDITPVHIEICKLNEKENLNYKFGKAENLPYTPESMDILISIQSIQAFDDLGSFFQKAYNTIKHKGRIILMDEYGISDSAKNSGVKDIDSIRSLVDLWFKDVEVEIITNNVKQACIEDSDLIEGYIEDIEVSEFMSQVSAEMSKKYEQDRGYFKLTATKISPDAGAPDNWSTVYEKFL